MMEVTKNMEILLIDIILCMVLGYVLFAIFQGLFERLRVVPIIRLDDSQVLPKFKKLYSGEPVLFFIMLIITLWIVSHLIYFGIRGYEIIWW